MIDLSPFDRHEKIALSFSGGKDSLACLYLLKDHLHRVTVYHLNTGDQLPEVHDAAEAAAEMCPNFVRIYGDVRGWIKENGQPTDLLPYSTHGIGVSLGQSGAKLVTRYHCCFVNLMWPLWSRIKADGNTLCIRGTKRADTPKMATEPGSLHDGVEMWFPVGEWSDDDVHAYLGSVGAPHNPLYDHLHNAPDCGRCTAWLNEKRGAYLKIAHPELFADYSASLKAIAAEVARPMDDLRHELAVMD